MRKNIEKIFFVLPINASELLALNSPPLRREYLSLTVNVLAKSLKSLHVTTRDFFQLNYLHNDQRIW